MQKFSCVMCQHEFDNDILRFEQKLVLDNDFCAKCWDEIMAPWRVCKWVVEFNCIWL